MQQLNSEPEPPNALWWVIGLVALVGLGLYFGWQVEGPGIPSRVMVAPRTYDAITLKLACSPGDLQTALKHQVRSWSAKTGGQVEWVAPELASEDLAIVSPTELGGRAASGSLAPFPLDFQAPQHPCQWNRIAVNYRLELAQWGGTIYGVPLSGDTSIVVFRADLFNDPQHASAFARKYSGRKLGPTALASWEEVLDVADYFASTLNKPSLPPVPQESARLLWQFQQIAACYDRLASTAIDSKLVSNSFYLADNGQPRLKAPAFQAAASWLAGANKYRMPAIQARSDQFEAIVNGSAVVAILTANEVGRLPRDPSGEVSSKFGFTRLPGSRSWFTATGERRVVPQVNYVPFLGFAASYGVVSSRSSSTHQAAAWDLLTFLISPETSIELVSNPLSGAGPVRDDLLSSNDRDTAWFNFGLDPERTTAFADAIRHYGTRAVARPVLTMRAPYQKALLGELEGNLRPVALGQVLPAEGLNKSQLLWEKLLGDLNPAEFQRWRQSEAGIR